MTALLFKLVLGAYVTGTVGYLVYLFAQRRVWSRVGLAALATGFLCQTIYYILETRNIGHFPIVTMQQTLSFFGWAVVGSYFVFQWKYNLRILGAFVAPVAVILVICSALFQTQLLPLRPSHRSFWLPVHVISIFLGNGIFAVAFGVSIMYLLQERSIKGKKLGFFFHRLPPLDRIDALNHGCLLVGFPLLTLGMISGAIYAQISLGSYWRWDPMEVWSLVTWLLYAMLLHQRLALGWQGRRAALLAIVGFTALLFTFLGAGVVMHGYHSFAHPEVRL